MSDLEVGSWILSDILVDHSADSSWLQEINYSRRFIYKLDDTMEIEKLPETFEGHLKKRVTYYQNKHSMKKSLERNETSETLTIDRDAELEDFVLPKSAIFMALCYTFYFQFMKGIVQMCIQAASYSLGTAIFIAFVGIVVNHAYYNAMMVGAKTKSVLIRTILKKSFVLNQLGCHNYPEGKINALITTDLNRIDFAGIAIPIIVITPLRY
ncbi:unnamed protein product [Ambrosiozyma monospora]|uniref:Unnamed protein product n=1 Tax=Ambrosiozyma monospora TaxID=43982 RepID=A0ACB5SYM5_AMBMO|nr:unnamed protein product [Ambrosiozyma monospora]